LSPETADGEDAAATTAENCKLNTENSVENDRGAVYFYGFRQIEENAVFYALAEAFVLPSLKEEWGLVVNEAMACSLPVIVSRTAGCAEDLLPGSESWQCSVGSIQFGEEKTTDDRKPLTDDSLEERSNGFAFDPRSSDALSEALRRIADCGTADGGAESARRPLGKPAATLKAVMGQRSREIVAKFSCENFARQALRAAEEASAP
jgi:glycosyltransferase involved in cell wall biosynthesis